MSNLVTLNVSKDNQYSHLNGVQFAVVEYLSYGVAINGINIEFPNNKVDFTFDEIKPLNLSDFLNKYFTVYTVGCDKEAFINMFGKVKFNEIMSEYEQFDDIIIYGLGEDIKHFKTNNTRNNMFGYHQIPYNKLNDLINNNVL